MKKKRNIIIGLISLIVVGLVAILIFWLLNDKNKLTVQERAWLDDNVNTIQNINIINNANVFGKNATGIFYDFLNDFSLEYGMQINPITYTTDAMPSGIALGVKNEIGAKDIVFYTDHYVLVSSKDETIRDLNDLKGKTIGVLNLNYNYVANYLKDVTLNSYENKEALTNALGTEVEYLIVPLMQSLDEILSKNYFVLYHFGDIKNYYVMQTTDETLSIILTKYFYKWQDNITNYFNDHEFSLFVETLKVSESEIAKLQSVVHNYGFVNNSPYEVIMGGEYGGIVAVYLSNFSEFANVEFKFIKYANMTKFKEAIANKKVNMYFNYANLKNDDPLVKGPVIPYVIASFKDNSAVINSLNSLANKTVYVEKDSKLHEYLKTLPGVTIKTFTQVKELAKVKKMDESYLLIDKNVYLYHADSELKKYAARYEGYLNGNYEFKLNDEEILSKLFSNYLKTLDFKEMEIIGLQNHEATVKAGSIMSRIAKYIIYLIVIVLIIMLILIRKSRKITIARRIKKDDKMKFIDQLTSLKNRNYLSENISVWNNNTIYPQAIVVIDLNRLQEINDLHGYEEGDKQIQAAANALIKTQLDNSEIMRTDGNEFVIYIVGYNEKQITNYIHKLSKEINKLPYDFGAEFGWSMIMDNIKTIEDAMNEAVEDMKKQKANENEKETKR